MGKYGYPEKQGLYDPAFEKDSCGVGFVVNVKGVKSHDIVLKGLLSLCNLSHRGAVGSDACTGDGAGILVQIPHQFFSRECSKTGFSLGNAGDYGVGMIFLPQDPEGRSAMTQLIESILSGADMSLIGWRDVPVDNTTIGTIAQFAEPCIRQVFIRRGSLDEDVFERRLYLVRKRIERAINNAEFPDKEMCYVVSLSCHTVVYKGQLTAEQVESFYPDLHDEAFISCLALVHSRYSTNTFPSWKLAQPFRTLAHNGEINTLRGNINWMRASESLMQTDLFGEDLQDLFPVIDETGSDSACFDNALEFLMLTGRDMPHAIMMMIPEAWENQPEMDPAKRAFYEYHACLMEQWDGPASIAFTNGRIIGATLDRNGLRPSRYIVTKDDLVIMASEVGVIPVDPADVLVKGRLQPGKMFLVDTEQGRIIGDEELKAGICSVHPYGDWLREHKVHFSDLPEPTNLTHPDHASILQRQQAFGYSQEDLKILMTPMAIDGAEPVGSMGSDIPLAVLSDRPQLLFNYFKQLFAQVTNPPVDPVREALVFTLFTNLGPEGNQLETTPEQCQMVSLTRPVVLNSELEQIRQVQFGHFKATTLSILYSVAGGADGLEQSLEDLTQQAEQAIADGFTILILSDRGVNPELAPIPSLLATGAVHQHLVRQGTRTRISLVVESGEPREVMHFAVLVGYGADVINPYLAFETLEDLKKQHFLPEDIDLETARQNYLKALDKGLLKIFSKMGISSIQSYRAAQIFEAIGLNHTVIDRYFTNTASRIEGVGLDVIHEEVRLRHDFAYAAQPPGTRILDIGGVYQWRQRGERHLTNPDMITALQESVRNGGYKRFQDYSRLINEQSQSLCTLRGLLTFKKRTPIPLDDVEPASVIVKRFCTGAMSYGSISIEAHETLAIAMNRLGGRSNSGEGGEDPARYIPDANGDSRSSAIKQIASGRFGVSSFYNTNAKELQIKIAQGAKPGEGGQLPGHKVSPEIARVRRTVPGVALISPPPHHDIYSIEDLAQLIFDLKNSNPEANVSVKLVAEIGVGTIAAGVSKGRSDLVLISGHDGGTGASPLSSIRHAGIPWEIGLAETQQVLVLNDLRGRIRVQTDGQLRTGRDVIIAAMLGADEFGFATSALMSIGCIMMRKCHLGTCPVGIATQKKELRQRFTGKPEHVVQYMTFIAEEAREIMATLGIRKLEDLIGHSDMLEARDAIDHWKARGLDFSKILYMPQVPDTVARRHVTTQHHALEDALDHDIIQRARHALENKEPVSFALPIQNRHRAVGAMLANQISKKHGEAGLPDDTIHIHFQGSAGQSFGAFNVNGVTLELEGDANDYLGKSMSGGRIVVYPPKESTFSPEENIIVGNVLMYGATGGAVYINGLAGERFCVRNSGAHAVVEGVGDHGCEYMTGGYVVVLGDTGRNFAAGMSGGIAFVYDPDKTFSARCNTGMVGLEAVTHEAEARQLRRMVERHQTFTGSTVAAALLADWENAMRRFVAVVPYGYREALAAMATTADGNGVMTAVAMVTNG